MKIAGLSIENFGPHEKTTLELAPVNVLLGRNEEGKSMVLDALLALKTGTCRGIDVKDNKELIRDGTDGWKIAAVIDGQQVGRTRTSQKGAMPGDARVLKAVFEAGKFLRGMDAKDRRELVASLVARPTTDLVAQLEAACADGRIVEAVKAGNLRRASSLATQVRRDADRDLEAARQRAAAQVLDSEVQTKAGPVKVSTIELGKAQAGLATARGRLEAALSAIAATQEWSRKMDAADDARAALAKFEETAVTWAQADEKALAVVEQKAKTSRELASIASTRRNERNQQAGKLRDLLAMEGNCPTCGQSMYGVQETVRDALGILEKEGLEAGREHKDALTVTERLDSEAAGLRARKQAAQGQEMEVARLTAKTVLGDPPPDTGTIDMATLRANVSRLEAIVKAREAYETSIRLGEQNKAALAGFEAAIAPAKAIEILCRPDALDDEEGVLERLNQSLSEPSKALFPGTVQAVQVTPSWEVTVAGRRACLASDAAQIRAGLVCAVALSVMSGLKLLVLDRLEAVLGLARKAILQLCLKMTREGIIDTAILCAAQQERVSGPHADGLRYFWIVNGTAAQL